MAQYILALDQGTTSSRAILFDHSGTVQVTAQEEFQQYYPRTGWVEHDPNELWHTQLKVANEALTKANISSESIAAIGITNQRETTIIWDKTTGKPIHNAIVWQDRRTASICDELKNQGKAGIFQEKTGLIIDAYFSGTKIKWLLDNIEGARQKAEAGQLAFGTVDSWLIWNLTQGRQHITEVTNASRTLIYNIHQLKWDGELIKILDIPQAMLPEVKSSSEIYGHTTVPGFRNNIPISGIAGDQQAALFGQMCTQAGMVKNTYGTGCFVVMNTGNKPIPSKNNLLTTIAWQIEGQVNYALEGSIFIAGAIVQWLRDEIGLIKSSEEIETLANTVEDNGDVYLVPALAGLGAPHWDPYARGTLTGFTRGTKSGHIARAALEGIAFQTLDVIEAMEIDANLPVKELRVDGRASTNNTLMQFQSDILQVPVLRPVISETTALGAAYLAGLAVKFWESTESIQELWQIEKEFHPKSSKEEVQHLIHYWQKAIERSKGWVEE